jgi:hypothetical protein
MAFNRAASAFDKLTGVICCGTAKGANVTGLPVFACIRVASSSKTFWEKLT